MRHESTDPFNDGNDKVNVGEPEGLVAPLAPPGGESPIGAAPSREYHPIVVDEAGDCLIAGAGFRAKSSTYEL